MDRSVICPKCGDDAREVSSIPAFPATPREGQQVALFTTLTCGCIVKDYYVYYKEMGWV